MLNEEMIFATKMDTGKGWDESTCEYVRNISKKCIVYQAIHEESAILDEKKYQYFTLLLIVLSFGTSVCSFTLTNGDLWKDKIMSILNVILSTLVTVNKFLDLQKVSIKHRNGSQQFLELHKNISQELIADESERIDSQRFIRWVGERFTRIRRGLPYPPRKLVSKYDKDKSILLEVCTRGHVFEDNKSETSETRMNKFELERAKRIENDLRFAT